MQRRTCSKGFTAVEALLAILVIAVLAFGGWWVWHKNREAKPASKSSNQTSRQTSTQQPSKTPTDPYAGWQTSCDAALKACYRYPSDWNASPYGGIQNTTGTAYARYQNPDNKDQAANAAYIASIDDLAAPNQGLKIVGYVVGNAPSYVVYDASTVSAKNLTVGQTTELVTGNPTFSGKSGHDAVTFVATPGANGLAAITTPDQAKAWFSTPEAKECLKVLQSFYYQ